MKRTIVAVLSTGFVGAAMAHGQTEDTAFGRAADPHKADRTVRIEMSDGMRFTPSALTVRQGDTVRLRVRNSGKLLHELVIGTDKELAEHAELMKKHPTMEHDEPYMAHVAPGKKGEIVWTFNRHGEFDFACLLPGHYEAGMVGKIRVVAVTTQRKDNRSKN